MSRTACSHSSNRLAVLVGLVIRSTTVRLNAEALALLATSVVFLPCLKKGEREREEKTAYWSVGAAGHTPSFSPHRKKVGYNLKHNQHRTTLSQRFTPRVEACNVKHEKSGNMIISSSFWLVFR